MLNFYDLTIPFRSLLILGLFLEFCINIYLLPSLFRKNTSLSARLITLLSLLVSALLMILYTGQTRAALRFLPVPALSDRLCRLPLLIPIALFLLILVHLIHRLVCEYRFHQKNLTRFSIKESVDKLTSGLCFYLEGGRVVLSNRRMNMLCFSLAGISLQNAELFWNTLQNGDICLDVQRLSSGSQPHFRLSDGTVWMFSCEKLGSLYQLTAANTTQIQAVTEELQEKNAELSALNLRLRKHGENLDELTRSQERLEIKTRIHSELGQALLSTRRYLVNEYAVPTPPLAIWQRNIAMLRKEAELKETEQPLDMLARIASATGIDIESAGSLPESSEAQKLFVQAAAEALTNAVRHARATVLYTAWTETDTHYTASFRNNGDIPKKAIIEGGGLDSLRKKIERAGGTMTVTHLPVFELTVTLPKERGDSL